MGRSPSHSWWWDSHNSPKHSKWLQSNLQDLDDKVKEMLRLIEEDADSFAQRAEMYYQKRPELVNLVEEFYRAYRSLAERYDHLTGEIRQNVPKALQLQYGLSCESPRSNTLNGSRHYYSPLRRRNPMFENLLKKASQMEGQVKEPDPTVDHTDHMQSLQGKCADDDECVEHGEQNSNEDRCVDLQHSSSDSGFSSASSDSEVDNLTPLTRLQQEINDLKEGNQVLADSHQKALQLNTSIHNKALKEIEEAYESKCNEADVLRSTIDALNEDLTRLRSVSEEPQRGVSVNNVREKEGQVETLPSLEQNMDSCTGDDHASELLKNADMVAESKQGSHTIETKGMEQQRTDCADGLQNHIAQLEEENRKQKLEILERGEEKREVIRQLSFSMDVLRSKNQRLEVMVGGLKKLHASNACVGDFSTSPAWKHLFSVGGWRVMKRGQPSATVAV